MDKYQKAALAMANKARSILGLPPVDRLYKGEPGDKYSCAVTNTIYDDDLDRKLYQVETDYQDPKRPLDEEISEGFVTVISLENGAAVFEERPDHDTAIFLDKFDNEEYPDLIDQVPE